MNFFILSLFSFYGLAHHTGVVIGTNSGVLLFLDTSTSGYASLLGSAPGGNAKPTSFRTGDAAGREVRT